MCHGELIMGLIVGACIGVIGIALAMFAADRER